MSLRGGLGVSSFPALVGESAGFCVLVWVFLGGSVLIISAAGIVTLGFVEVTAVISVVVTGLVFETDVVLGIFVCLLSTAASELCGFITAGFLSESLFPSL